MFDCERCGSCCRQVGKLAKGMSLCYLLFFRPKENGWCQYLANDNGWKCLIYDKRPLACRVDEMWKVFNKHTNIDRYYKITKDACQVLRKIENG